MSEGQSKTANKLGRGANWIAMVTIVALVVVVAIAGVVAQMAGYGFLGYRLILYGQGELYVLNLSDDSRQVSVDEGPPQQVVADNARLLPLVGGQSSIEAWDSQGNKIGQWAVESDGSGVLLNLSESTCLVVSEVSGLGSSQAMKVEIVTWLEAEDRLYSLPTERVIWPRGYPGAIDAESEPVVAVEVLDCQLVGETDFVADYLGARLAERLTANPPPQPM